MRRITTPRNFIRWLEKQPRSARYVSTYLQCPLARYSGTIVDADTYGIDNSERILPKWAQEFIRRFDDGMHKSPARCLQIMRSL